MKCKYGIYLHICNREGCYDLKYDKRYCRKHYDALTYCTYIGCTRKQLYRYNNGDPHNETRCYEHSVKGRREFKIQARAHHKPWESQQPEEAAVVEQILGLSLLKTHKAQ